MPDALLTELELLERGVWLAYQREKVPTYRMELQAVWETARLAVKLRRAEINPCPGDNTIGDTLLRVPPCPNSELNASGAPPAGTPSAAASRPV